MKSLSLNQRRFLIVWILFNSFALYVNLADVEGAVDLNPSSSHSYRPLYCLTRAHNVDSFWPFSSFYRTDYDSLTNTNVSTFLGIFNSYGLKEYIFYMALGFAIVFVPKLWKDKKPAF
jgi:hypothetical protein